MSDSENSNQFFSHTFSIQNCFECHQELNGLPLWCIYLGWLPAALSLPLLNRIGGKHKIKNLVCQDKDRVITF